MCEAFREPMSNGTETPGGAQPAVPAGWYPHPTAPGWEAYWTGVAWGTETRPAQAAAAAPAAEQPATQVYGQPTAQPATGQPTAQQPAQEPAAQQPAAAAATQQAAVTGQQPAAAATVATAPAAAREGTRSGSALPAILCVLGAVVAIVGAFLPMAKIDLNQFDIADNTMVAAGYGLAVIAAAVIGAAIAIWAHLKGAGNWLPILLGAVVVAIAAYAWVIGLDDIVVDIPSLPDAGGGEAAQDLTIPGQSGDPSTGIYAVGAGGILMILGGIGLLRGSR